MRPPPLMDWTSNGHGRSHCKTRYSTSTRRKISFQELHVLDFFARLTFSMRSGTVSTKPAVSSSLSPEEERRLELCPATVVALILLENATTSQKWIRQQLLRRSPCDTVVHSSTPCTQSVTTFKAPALLTFISAKV